jgi:hypothetical protein
MRRAYAGFGLISGAVAVVGFAALFEHFAALKDSAWLRNVLPFGLATDPTWLAAISQGALAVSVLLFRLAKAL